MERQRATCHSNPPDHTATRATAPSIPAKHAGMTILSFRRAFSPARGLGSSWTQRASADFCRTLHRTVHPTEKVNEHAGQPATENVALLCHTVDLRASTAADNPTNLPHPGALSRVRLYPLRICISWSTVDEALAQYVQWQRTETLQLVSVRGFLDFHSIQWQAHASLDVLG
jgi:hypothetical protein